MAQSNYFAKRKIVVPFDFSKFSAQAVETACEIASENERVTVLHAINPAQLYGLDDNGGYALGDGMTTVMSNTQGVKEIDESNQQNALQAMQAIFADSKYSGIRFEAVVDDPRRGILEYASRQDCELIVMPTQGRTGKAQGLIGSVAEHVVRSARCPVLVLRCSNIET